MSLKKSAAFSLILAVLAIGLKVPTPSGLIVDGFRSASLLTARSDGRAAADVAPSQSLSYINPIYTDPDDRFSKDPAVIEHEGKYYIYYFGFTPSGREAIKVASSQDLVRWRHEGVALEAGKDGSWDADLIWAPDVIFRDGLFYMYYAGGHLRPEGDIDWSSMRIGLAISREPAGRFVRSDQNPVLTPPFGNGIIDPDFFADDGKDYLYYVVQTSFQGHWEGIRVQRVDGMVHFYDDVKVIEPTVDWEGNIVEAPTVFKANGYYYLLYSGGASDYGQRIGYAFSRDPVVSGRSGAGNWTKYPKYTVPQPLIDHGDKWADLAVGSTSLLLGLNRELYVVFQGKNGLDGKFRLGMARLSLSDQHGPVRLVW